MVEGVSVADPDVSEVWNGTLILTLSAAHGSLAVDALVAIQQAVHLTEDGTVSLGGAYTAAPAKELVLKATPSRLNNLLATLKYIGDTDFSGADVIAIGARDVLRTASKSKSIACARACARGSARGRWRLRLRALRRTYHRGPSSFAWLAKRMRSTC